MWTAEWLRGTGANPKAIPGTTGKPKLVEIDRLIHHAVILEMTGTSYRTEEAKKRAEPTTTTKVEQ